MQHVPECCKGKLERVSGKKKTLPHRGPQELGDYVLKTIISRSILFRTISSWMFILIGKYSQNWEMN